MKLRDIIALMLLATLAVACSSDVDFPAGEGEGQLRLAMPNVSAVTRSVPAELGVPAPEDFNLRIINTAGREVYNGSFTEQEFTLPIGNYTVRATYGSNPLLGLDTPYYIAETQATVEKAKTTELQLQAAVGNALVSAVFGRDAEEQARFDRFYTDYALYVHIGNKSIPITKDQAGKSIYLQAGSHATLSFWGRLKLESDREVTMELESDDFPATLNPADHAIITLCLPDPESALTVDITKVSLESITLEETIPLSWLPVPTVACAHRYNASGNLVGTDLTFSNSYVGMNWRAVISNAAGTDVRLVQGTGELTSNYTSSASWPYLPQGKYKASYYIVADDGSAKIASSREFIVPAPTLKLTVGGYSSYTKYLEGDIEAANACERLTVYEPSVALNIDRSLLTNSNYPYSFTFSYDGAKTTVAAGLNNYFLGNLTNQAVRAKEYVLAAEATFDGVSIAQQKDFVITGLPANFNPPSEANGWKETKGTVNFEGSYAQLGNWSWSNPHEMKNTTWVNIPEGTKINLTYKANITQGTVDATLKVSLDDGSILLETDKSGDSTGTTAAITTKARTTELICEGSWGSGATQSKVYQLDYRYSN